MLVLQLGRFSNGAAKALARAAFCQPDVVVLDDVLSALDRPTAEAIFSRLFGPNGLLKKSNTTIILATHSGNSQYIPLQTDVIADCRCSGTLQ